MLDISLQSYLEYCFSEVFQLIYQNTTSPEISQDGGTTCSSFPRQLTERKKLICSTFPGSSKQYRDINTQIELTSKIIEFEDLLWSQFIHFIFHCDHRGKSIFFFFFCLPDKEKSLKELCPSGLIFKKSK